MKTEDLLLCPFCGSAAVRFKEGVRCVSSSCGFADDRVAMTVEEWNTRHNPKERELEDLVLRFKEISQTCKAAKDHGYAEGMNAAACELERILTTNPNDRKE